MPVPAMVLPQMSRYTTPKTAQRATAIEIPARLKHEFAKPAHGKPGRGWQTEHEHVCTRTAGK